MSEQRNIDFRAVLRRGLAGAGLSFVVAASPLTAQLGTLGSLVLEQGSAGVAGTAQEGDSLGGALAVGDFDGDGFADLAVGAPGDVFVQNTAGAGLVQVFYGSPQGLSGARDQIFSQSTSGIPGVSEPEDEFGFALAAIDIDCDGFDDLAIGAPGEDFGDFPFEKVDAGAVWILLGSASGLTASGAFTFNLDDAVPLYGADSGDQFGSSLVGLSNGSTESPVRRFIVGAPGKRIQDSASGSWIEGAGAIFGLRDDCGGAGLGLAGDIYEDQQQPGVSGTPESGDRFAATLSKGDFDGDGIDDLVVGVEFEDLPTDSEGIVHVFYGDPAGAFPWSGATEESWSQDSADVDDVAEAGERFGRSLASGDFDGDGEDDLAVGVLEDIDGEDNAGGVAVLYGGSGGLSGVGDQLWSQAGAIADTPEGFDQLSTALAAGDFDGDGADDLAIGVAGEGPAGGPESAGAVNVIYGLRFFGLDSPRNQIFDQETPGIAGTAEFADGFGDVLAVGDFNADGRDDLAIGVPREDVGSASEAGIVQVLYGSSNGVLSEVRFTTAGVLVVTENTINLILNVERVGGANLALEVSHRLAPAPTTATPGVDFEYTPGTLAWAAGELGTKSIHVRLLEDDLAEATEHLRIELHSPSAGAAIASPTSRTLQIDDDGDSRFFADDFEGGDSTLWSASQP